MFNALWQNLASTAGLTEFKFIVTRIEQLVEIFNEHQLIDKDCKNAAIDSIIEILQQYKD